MKDGGVIGPPGVSGGLIRKNRRRRRALMARSVAERQSGPRRNDLSPQLHLVNWPIAKLQSARRKVRVDDAAQITRIRHAIEALGFCSPLLIKSDGEVIDGHQRLEAAKQLALAEVPCVEIDHLSAVEIRVLRIALNRLPERSEWDFTALTLEFRELLDLGAPVEVAGFDPAELDTLLLDDDPPPHEEGPLEPDGDAAGIAQEGDLWRLGRHLLICGDARDREVYARLFADGRWVQLVLTDVPFNVPIVGHVTGGRHREFAMASGEMSRDEFAAFNAAWIAACLHHLSNGGLLATFIDWRSVELVLAVGRGLGLSLLNLVVWAKENAGMGSTWRSQHELLPVFRHGDAAHRNNVELGRHGRHRSNLWTYPGASTMGSDARKGLKFHPTTKPVALLSDALLDVTDRGDVVLDPFLGSGSTLIAAEKTRRICRAIELDPLYVDVAIRRWRALTGEEPELLDATATHARPPTERQLLLPKPRIRITARRSEG